MSELGYAALGLAVVGAIFCGVYATGRERLWWAIIPGLGAFTLMAVLFTDAYIGTDLANDWASVFVISAGAALIAGVLKRADAKRVLATVAGFALAIGILMAPLPVATRILFVAVAAAAAAMMGWRGGGRRTTLRSH